MTPPSLIIVLILVLVLAGWSLLYLELFLPGMIAGMVGLGCLVAAALEAFHATGPRIGLMTMGGEILGAILILATWVRFFPTSQWGRRMILQTFNPPPAAPSGHGLQPGRIGQALTELRPAGTAVFEGKRLDVVSESTFIPAGETVIIEKIEPYRVVVRPQLKT